MSEEQWEGGSKAAAARTLGVHQLGTLQASPPSQRTGGQMLQPINVYVGDKQVASAVIDHLSGQLRQDGLGRVLR